VTQFFPQDRLAEPAAQGCREGRDVDRGVTIPGRPVPAEGLRQPADGRREHRDPRAGASVTTIP
jgi:hypothetical protein